MVQFIGKETLTFAKLNLGAFHCEEFWDLLYLRVSVNVEAGHHFSLLFEQIHFPLVFCHSVRVGFCVNNMKSI